MSASFPKFFVNASGSIRVTFSNFTGELTVKDIIELKKYVQCPIPKQETSSDVEHVRSSPAGGSGNISQESAETKPAAVNQNESSAKPGILNDDVENEDDDTDTIASPILLEDSDLNNEEEGRKDLSVAYDEEIECDFALSQQVDGRGRYWLR